MFVRLAPVGVGFHEFFGESLSSIDNMVDRSPEGRLEVAGGVLRYLHDCNWKMFVENLNDAMHPMVAHESSAGTARRLWEAESARAMSWRRAASRWWAVTPSPSVGRHRW